MIDFVGMINHFYNSNGMELNLNNSPSAGQLTIKPKPPLTGKSAEKKHHRRFSSLSIQENTCDSG